MDFEEQIRECKAQALRMVNWADDDYAWIMADDLLEMLPVRIYSDEEAREQLES